MVYILYDLKCDSCDHIYEDMIDRKEADEVQVCPECGNIAAKRTIVPIRIALDGCDPANTTAYDKWARNHEEAARVAKQKLRDHGDESY